MGTTMNDAFKLKRRFLAFTLFTWVFVAGCSQTEVAAPPALSDSLPPTIGSVELSELITGANAAEISAKLHKGQLEEAKDMAIGKYGPNISVWLSEYATEEAARSETDRMVVAMRRFGGGFENVQEITVNSQAAYVATVQGKPQYFWSVGNILVYVVAGEATKQDLEALTRHVQLFNQ